MAGPSNQQQPQHASPSPNGQHQAIAQQLTLLQAQKQQATPSSNTLPSAPQIASKQKRKKQKSKRTWFDWLKLLVQIIGAIAIPLGIIIGVQQFNTQQLNDQNRTIDQEQQATLETYLDRMSDLLFNQHLNTSRPGDEVRSVARARTLVALQNLNPTRKGILIQFLYQSQLIYISQQPYDNNPIIDLFRADLSKADLFGADLNGADLNGANLNGADLNGADLNEAYLNGAILSGANLSGADLLGAYLLGADLNEATITQKQIDQAYTCKDTITPQGITHSQIACP